jgi:internalin A
MSVIAMGGVAGSGEGGAAGEMLPVIDCSTITLADSQLEAAILNQLDTVGPLTPADIADLTDLDARGFGVAELGGIECFTELATLDFGVGGQTSNIGDLAPLVYLKKLTSVSLDNNPIASLEPLGKLPLLTDLSLKSAVQNVDLSPLASSASITTLDLSNDSLGDLTPLGSIAALTTLYLRTANLSAPASLAKLKNVKSLDLVNTISDATPLVALTQLVTLEIGTKTLTNFDKLAPLVNLTSLKAESAGLTSITGVTNMTKLTYLDLAFNQVADIAPLQGLINLQTLFLNLNPVTNITPLVNNAGIATGDTIGLFGTSLSCATEGPKVTTLIGRGATVTSPCN